MTPPLSPEVLTALQKLDTCTVANAIETFNVRLRNEGYAQPGSVSCMTPNCGPVVGYAETVKIRCSSLPMTGGNYIDRTDWWNHLVRIPGPRIVVIDDADEKPGTGAFLGEVHAAILQRLGCVGAVTNGSVRDLPAIARMGFSLFAGGPAVSHAYVHIVDYGCPVTLGGLTIQPGDLLHADVHGVLSVPLEIAADIPAAANQLFDREGKVLELCRSADFSLAKLQSAVRGVFD
jgi:regulator of RNase E activity RraA